MAEETKRDYAREQAWYDQKSTWMESILGPQHGIVMHAIIPFDCGGALDLYYFPNSVPGTAIATKELTYLPNEGSSNKAFSCYELVMFTRQAIDLQEHYSDTDFGRAEKSISAILNRIAWYSADASLNPAETCEFPSEMETVGGKCLIFDDYASFSNDTVRNFGLLLIIEIFRSEMEFAMKKGGDRLLHLLKQSGHYPYSDLDRQPVA